mmetsp:Transcript_97752/g.193548  ORF Transcript_97752/g.193548 Transcript_97752/m.193548 type:complete len:209 (-) Transcript_97752:224-850(-)
MPRGSEIADQANGLLGAKATNLDALHADAPTHAAAQATCTHDYSHVTQERLSSLGPHGSSTGGMLNSHRPIASRGAGSPRYPFRTTVGSTKKHLHAQQQGGLEQQGLQFRNANVQQVWISAKVQWWRLKAPSSQRLQLLSTPVPEVQAVQPRERFPAFKHCDLCSKQAQLNCRTKAAGACTNHDNPLSPQPALGTSRRGILWTATTRI